MIDAVLPDLRSWHRPELCSVPVSCQVVSRSIFSTLAWIPYLEASSPQISWRHDVVLPLTNTTLKNCLIDKAMMVERDSKEKLAVRERIASVDKGTVQFGRAVSAAEIIGEKRRRRGGNRFDAKATGVSEGTCDVAHPFSGLSGDGGGCARTDPTGSFPGI